MEEIISELRSTRTYKDIYDLPWKMMMKNNDKLSKNLSNKLRIALICHPCYGFGDIIFAFKMYQYIKKWYGIKCTMLTTKPKPFLQNGLKDVYCLKKPGSSKYVECDNLKFMKIYNIDKDGKPTTKAKLKHEFDLIMVTPWIGSDYEPDKNIVKKFLPYANKFNTMLFSEYNPDEPKKYDFPTGIGKNLFGVLLTQFKFEKTIKLKNPYLMVHLTNDYRVNVGKCFSNFIKLMCKKYHKHHRKLDVVIPKHVLEDKESLLKLFNSIRKNGYYQNFIIKTDKNDKSKTPDNTLTLRADIGPLPYGQYTGLFKNCLPDVLITGDQSVTDIISCCKDFNIYYQIMPWKTGFAKNLAIGLKQDFIRKVSTSCGLEKFSTKMHTNIKNVAKNHDFVKLGKPKLDAILMAALEIKKNKNLQKFVKAVLTSRKKVSLINKLKNH